MKRIIRCIAAALALMLFALCFTGCFSTAESRQADRGKELMEAYLKTRDAKKTSVDSAVTDRARTAADRIEMTEFVQGKYRVDGQEYEYWVNVETGEIYTSERIKDIEACCYALMLSELDIDPARCVGLCNVYFPDAPRDRVMPAEIEDTASYARSHFHSDELGLQLWLVCSASEAMPNRWTIENTKDWNQDEAHICLIPAGEALPEFGNGVNLGYSYFRDFTGDKYVMSSEAVDYTPHL